MRIFGRLAIACVVVFALLQLVRPSIPAKPATAEVKAPPQVRHILNKDCYSCHWMSDGWRGSIRLCPPIGWCATTCCLHARV